MHSWAFHRFEAGWLVSSLVLGSCFLYRAIAVSTSSVFSKFARLANSIRAFLVTVIVLAAFPLRSMYRSKFWICAMCRVVVSIEGVVVHLPAISYTHVGGLLNLLNSELHKPEAIASCTAGHRKRRITHKKVVRGARRAPRSM